MNQLHHVDVGGTKMVNLRRASKDKDTVGRFKPEGRCKKHFKHRQSPGVCSLCLREKLTQLSLPTSRPASSASPASSSASSLSSYYSSSSASSCASPLHYSPNFTKTRSSSVVSIFLLNGKHALVRSRSLAVGHKTTRKGGFWNRLLHPTKSSEEIHRAEEIIS